MSIQYWRGWGVMAYFDWPFGKRWMITIRTDGTWYRLHAGRVWRQWWQLQVGPVLVSRFGPRSEQPTRERNAELNAQRIVT